MPKTRKTTLLLIHPQNSFCKLVPAKDQQQVHDGELCAPGAWEDMQRVASLIGRLGHELTDIHVTMDSRHLLHVSHPLWFRDTRSRHPEPFTVMREEQGEIIGSQGDARGKLRDTTRYTTAMPWALPRTLDYLKKLAEGKRYPHHVWPPHCLLGTPGHEIAASIMQAVLGWCEREFAMPYYCSMGGNVFVEHFGAVRRDSRPRRFCDATKHGDDLGIDGSRQDPGGGRAGFAHAHEYPLRHRLMRCGRQLLPQVCPATRWDEPVAGRRGTPSTLHRRYEDPRAADDDLRGLLCVADRRGTQRAAGRMIH